MREEKWVPVKGYEGLYEICGAGKIRSIDRYVLDKRGRRRFLKSVPLTLSIGTHGYDAVTLCRNGKPKTNTVHRLVAIHFTPVEEGKDFVNHIDGDKRNNRADNLEWVTSSENTIHGLSLGIMNTAKGTQKPNCILNEAKVREIKQHLANGVKMTQIAPLFGIHKNTVYAIKHEHTWKYVKI